MEYARGHVDRMKIAKDDPRLEIACRIAPTVLTSNCQNAHLRSAACLKQVWYCEKIFLRSLMALVSPWMMSATVLKRLCFTALMEKGVWLCNKLVMQSLISSIDPTKLYAQTFRRYKFTQLRY